MSRERLCALLLLAAVAAAEGAAYVAPQEFKELASRRRALLGTEAVPGDYDWREPGWSVKRFFRAGGRVREPLVPNFDDRRGEDPARTNALRARKMLGSGPEYWWQAVEPAPLLRAKSRLPVVPDAERFARAEETMELGPRHLLAAEATDDRGGRGDGGRGGPASYMAEAREDLTQRIWHQHEARPVYERVDNSLGGWDEPYLDPQDGHVKT